MLPKITKLSSVALYTPDPHRALELYQELGLEPKRHDEAHSEGAGTQGACLRFAMGDTELVLHNDRQRQFVELSVCVDDVRDFYKSAAKNSDYTWIETPHLDGREWRAVVRLPDDNIFTLRSSVPPQGA